MLQIRSILDVADNTGAKRAAAIAVHHKPGQRYAFVGDIIKAHIKEAAPDATVKKGEVVDAVVVRPRKAIRRSDGSYLRFDSNATGPKMRVPRGLSSASMMTMALLSKRR